MELTQFQPELIPAHLDRLVGQIRAVMPARLFAVIEPWTTRPRRYHDDSAPATGDPYGLALPGAGELATCEVHAPIRWHEVVAELSGLLVLRHPAPDTAQLSSMWVRLEQAGLRPSITVNLSPWRTEWSDASARPAPGTWAVDILGVAGRGADLGNTRTFELARVLNGSDVDPVRAKPVRFPLEQWTYWPTV
ncbi:hypothetical protein ACIP5Y_22705 [Nocardia sp. NPDC088792]|uniref:hypothetical protein n=1 Tax=Nocardia sp. NPDC088792 TaxID=3364332 RepID=UPI0037FD2FB2